MECKNCNVVISDKNKFCSKSCAASYNNSRRKPRSDESKQKTSSTLKKHFDENHRNIDFSQLMNNEKKLLESDFHTLGFERKRKRIILEQENKCNKCGVSEWLGQKLTLEIDHKDGNNTNDVRDNLEGLCPNCHSLTLTWRGRNKNYILDGRLKVTDKQIFDEFQKTFSIRQTLLNLNLAAKGGNYGRVKRILTQNDIDYTKYLNYTNKRNKQIKFKTMVELICPVCEETFIIAKNLSGFIPCKSKTINCCSKSCSVGFINIRRNLSEQQIYDLKNNLFVSEFIKK